MQYPLLALRGVAIFPNIETRFDVDREKSIKAIDAAVSTGGFIVLSNQKDPLIDLPTKGDIYETAVLAKIKRVLKLPGEHLRVLVVGQQRFAIKRFAKDTPYFLCEGEILEDICRAEDPDLLAMVRMAESLFAEYKVAHQKFPGDVFKSFAQNVRPGYAADFITANMNLSNADVQSVLSAIDVSERLEIVIDLLARETEITKIEGEISEKLQSRISQGQREQYLREQIKTIQDELGDGEDIESEADAWRQKLSELKLSEKITEKIEKEIKRASKLNAYSPDLSVLRNYIECILDLPWNEEDETEKDLSLAAQVLDEDHFGLEKVKERILEYLAVKFLSKEEKGPIICLVGPPGVGKTSIAKSIARATGRKFVHMSLGGVRDEAEIRGHRRTYIGAIPGSIMTQLRECHSKNPVFLFDEVDKIGSDFRGDPASALLEVLDPEQNKEFVDHFLEVPFDLSNVLFITTANTTETIPRPLLDRMEVIEISSYIREEKLEIAKRYLVPKQIKANGLSAKNISISVSALKELIDSYTRESGVRGLEKEISNLCRKVARKVVEGDKKKHSITSANIEEYLGKKKYHNDKLLGKNEVGVATGMAWTVVGGETLFVETAVVPGSGQIQLTGQLGDVMQESAKTAISYVRSVADKFKIDKNFYKEKDIHIHVPEGAVPKDGPSAGVTMCVSLISALSGKPVRKDIAMTGEISLRGKVLPVGGIKEKVIAAHRLGVKKILLPIDNKRDIEDLPESVRRDLKFVLLTNISDAIKEAVL